MAFLPQFIIKELKLSVPLHEILDREVGLKKLKSSSSSPNKFTACCPFHDDKTPSFNIDDDKGIYHCFGCNEEGDVIDFLINHKGLSFKRALEEVCESAGTSLEEASKLVNELTGVSGTYKMPDPHYAFTNSIFNEKANYNSLEVPLGLKENIAIPNSLNEMAFVLTSRAKLFSAGTSKTWEGNIINNKDIENAAKACGALVGKDLSYAENFNLLPFFEIKEANDRYHSNLPLIVNNGNRLLQIQCSGFAVLDHELEYVGVYPEAIKSARSSFYMPIPSQISVVENIDNIFITDSPEQYIDLVACGVTNLVSPVSGIIDQALLRQFHNLPTKRFTWVTTIDTLNQENILAKLAIFRESLGSGMSLDFVFLKNNESQSSFSDFVIKNKDAAIKMLTENILSLEQVLTYCIPSLDNLENTNKKFAIRAVQEIIKTTAAKSYPDAISILTTLSATLKKPSLTLISDIYGLEATTMKRLNDLLSGLSGAQYLEVDYTRIARLNEDKVGQEEKLIMRAEMKDQPNHDYLDRLLLTTSDLQTIYGLTRHAVELNAQKAQDISKTMS